MPKYFVGNISDFPINSSHELAIADRIVALYNVDGQYFALDGVCPHAGGPLGEGYLTGTRVTCPWHGWQFDVTTGRHCLTPHIVQQQFPTSLEGERIFIEIEDELTPSS